MSIFVQYAPYHLKNGTWPEKREALGDAVIDTLSEYAPNLKNIILHRQVVTPWDLEQEFGLTEGNIFQGELTLDQLFFLRPVPGWAKYRTPIKNLYMCGACTHPGGGVMIAYWSQMGLNPGDVLTTGTPRGVAAGRKPDQTPWWLKPGDVVEAEIENIGLLKNRIVAE